MIQLRQQEEWLKKAKRHTAFATMYQRMIDTATLVNHLLEGKEKENTKKARELLKTLKQDHIDEQCECGAGRYCYYGLWEIGAISDKQAIRTLGI